jgi:RNA polymerase-binding transcription factor DksA
VPGLFLIRHKLAHERREQNDAADREEDASELQLIRQQQELSGADHFANKGYPFCMNCHPPIPQCGFCG